MTAPAGYTARRRRPEPVPQRYSCTRACTAATGGTRGTALVSGVHGDTARRSTVDIVTAAAALQSTEAPNRSAGRQPVPNNHSTDTRRPLAHHTSQGGRRGSTGIRLSAAGGGGGGGGAGGAPLCSALAGALRGPPPAGRRLTQIGRPSGAQARAGVTDPPPPRHPAPINSPQTPHQAAGNVTD